MSNFTKTSIYILVACIAFTTKAFSITRVSATSGNWGSATTWNPAGAPTCGDSICIQATHTISISTQQNYNGCGTPFKIVIYGKLKFFNGSKLNLPCGSYILVYPGGRIEADVGLSNSNLIEICGAVEWNSNNPLNGPACIPIYNSMCNSVLPVELKEFSAAGCYSDKICLKWETASEINNDYFEVQHSLNAIDFYPVLHIYSKAPAGNSHNNIFYSGTHDSPIAGVNYYRLKQTDKDGSFSYGPILSVQHDYEKGLQFSVFPNVGPGQFSVRINGLDNAGGINIVLKNTSGAIVYKAWKYAEENNAEIKVIPSEKLPDGLYFCSFIIGDAEHVVKLIVANP